MSNLKKYLSNFNQAQSSNDPLKMMEAMQDFFKGIYELNFSDASEILGLYSMTQQLEKLGVDSSIIKSAIHAHVSANYMRYPALWEQIAQSLNPLFEKDGLTMIELQH